MTQQQAVMCCGELHQASFIIMQQLDSDCVLTEELSLEGSVNKSVNRVEIVLKYVIGRHTGQTRIVVNCFEVLLYHIVVHFAAISLI